jgi:hypothetical protein
MKSDFIVDGVISSVKSQQQRYKEVESKEYVRKWLLVTEMVRRLDEGREVSGWNPIISRQVFC